MQHDFLCATTLPCIRLPCSWAQSQPHFLFLAPFTSWCCCCALVQAAQAQVARGLSIVALVNRPCTLLALGVPSRQGGTLREGQVLYQNAASVHYYGLVRGLQGLMGVTGVTGVGV